MNKFQFMGRLTRDPEVKTTQGENPMKVARYTLAVPKKRTSGKDGKAESDFLGCVAFGKNAEFMEKYCKQGTKLVVTGKLQSGSYTNKEGQKVYTTDVVVDEQEFAESKGSANAEPVAEPDDGIDEELPFN